MIDAAKYRAIDKLKDGTPVVVRAIQPEDKDRILDAFQGLDRDSVYTRFFAYKKELTDSDLSRITGVDFENVVALVVIIQHKDGERLIGGGRYYREAEHNNAEIAFMIVDAYHGCGGASLILRHLTSIARAQGIRHFEAEVLARNGGMLAVFNRSGLPMKIKNEGLTVHVTLSLAHPERRDVS